MTNDKIQIAKLPLMKKVASALSILLLIVSLLAGCRSRDSDSGPVSLSFYGLDTSDSFDGIISAYREKYSGVTIKYKKFNDPVAFEDLLVNEIAEGEGPDIFYIHNTWLPRHTKKIVPLKSEALTQEQFGQTFVNVAQQDFIQPDPKDGATKIYALPLYVDTLALYYNKNDFEQAIPQRGIPAKTWSDFEQDAPLLREERSGVLEKGAIALGRSDNLSLATDILYNFFVQDKVDIFDADFKRLQFATQGQKWFDYFLSFANSQKNNYSWDKDIATSELAEVEAFLTGKVSSILGYSDLYPRLENHIKNIKTRSSSVIDLSDIGVAPVPQVDEQNPKVFADYYGLAVSRNSKNPSVAWDFIQFATSKESATAYHKKTKRPTARRDLIVEQKKEPVTEIFVSQLGFASSLRIFSDQRFEEAFKKAVAKTHDDTSQARDALSTAQTELSEILKVEVPNGLYPKSAGQK